MSGRAILKVIIGMPELKKTLRNGEDDAPAGAPLIHELTEALTATGNYLTAATQMLEAKVDPPEEQVLEVLRKSMVQFSRATEALRRLQAAVLPGR